MDKVKAKNFIIIVLLIMDAILLALIGADLARSASSSRAALEGAVSVLAENGISVSENLSFDAGPVNVYTTSRDEQLERQHVNALLGESEYVDLGGSIITYYALDGSGEATFRGVGGIQVRLGGWTAGEGFNAENEARQMASELGIEVLTGSGTAQVNVNEEGGGTVVLFCAHEGVLIANCRLVFTFGDGSVVIEGTRPLDTVTSAVEADPLDAPTALMRFLELLRERGQVCSEISSASLAYYFTATAAGDGTLEPVWRIITDTGDFYLNAVTGAAVKNVG